MLLLRNHGKLYYEVYGQGDIIIFLNGFASGISTWYPVIKDLKKNYKCIVYDYIGTGESTNYENYIFSFESYCSDLQALIDLYYEEHIHIVGYSMGGWVAQYFLSKRNANIKSLTLINTSSKIFSRQKWVISHLIDVLRMSDLSVFSKIMFLTYYSPEYLEKNIEYLERMKKLSIQTFEKQKKENWERLLESCISFDEESSISKLTIPVLMISGEYDFLCPKITAKQLNNLIPDLKWFELKSAGHAIPMECSREIREIIANFICDVEYE